MKKTFEISQNFIYSILDNFRDKDKKRVARYLYKYIRQVRKELRRRG